MVIPEHWTYKETKKGRERERVRERKRAGREEGEDLLTYVVALVGDLQLLLALAPCPPLIERRNG